MADDIVGSSQKLIRKNIQHWNRLPTEKALHPWWFSRYNWTNPQLTWSNPGNSEEKSGLHRPLPSSPSDSMVSSLPQHSLSQKTMLAHSAEEKSRNSLSSELSYTLSLCPPYESYAHTIISNSYQYFHAQIAGCKYILKRPFRTIRRPDHLPLFLNIRTTLYYLKDRNRNQIKSFKSVVLACHLNARQNKITPFDTLCKTILVVFTSTPK